MAISARGAADSKLFRLIGGALAALVLLQAGLAGQFLNRAPGARSVHRLIGELLGVVALALAAQGYRLRKASPQSWWLGVAVLVLVVTQTGLGFAGRDAAGAAALHIPVGVATFGVALLTALPDRSRPTDAR